MPCTGWIVNGVHYPDKPPQWVVDKLVAIAAKMAKKYEYVGEQKETP